MIYSATNPAPQRPDPYAQPLAASARAPRAALSIDVRVNRNAMIGFVTGIIALFANFFFVLGPISIVFSALGIVRARELKARGVTNNLVTWAFIGLVLGIVATVIGLVTIIVFVVSLSVTVG